MRPPRILIAGLKGGSGKTLLSVGLAAALRGRDRTVAPFKKGPDYIDAAWLSAAADRSCRNLDLYMMREEAILRSFLAAGAQAEMSVIEGNRGLFDGMDVAGTCSTAELAKLLRAPVLLAVDCTKSTRTAAALVLGCLRMDPDVPIRGVLLNRIAGRRHESVIRDSIARACGVPVVGAIPRLRRDPFPERHLGLVPPQESGGISTAIEEAAAAVRRHVDLEAVERIAGEAPDLEAPGGGTHIRQAKGRVRIGVFRDAAFQFYYPENLDALVREGADLVEISPLRDAQVPGVDALYLGGGFPETLAPRLSLNTEFRESVRACVEGGMPVYAECGGVVYLGEKLVMDKHEYPMAGALPLVLGFGRQPQGHGYVELETVGENPFYAAGERIRGHEFHHTHVLERTAPALRFAFRVRRGFGFDGERDGLVHRGVLACYTHVHALGTEGWASSVVRQAVLRRPT